MKVDPLVASNARAAGAAPLLIQGDGDFAAKLTLGQILKGRVLRSYDGQRYAVEFDGQRRVVDSAVPLTTGEILHGRVVGLGEQVTLQRLWLPGDEAVVPVEVALPDVRDAGPDAIATLFERFGAKLDAAELAALQRLAGRTVAPEQAALAGLVLRKIGLPISPELLRAVQATLSKSADTPLFALPAQALALASARPAAADHEALPALAAWLERSLAVVPEAGTRKASGDDGADRDGGQGGGNAGDDLARRVFNAQNGGSVAHRVGTLPLLLDGELVELDIALFAQLGDDAGENAPQAGIRHRELVFALTTAELGRLEIRALLADGHLRLRIAADAGRAAERLAGHADVLAASLQGIGWQLDEQRYEGRVGGASHPVLASVVEHLISPGSVSRLA